MPGKAPPDVIKRVQQHALLKCRQIELQPELYNKFFSLLPKSLGGSLEEARKHRYPVERKFQEYKEKLFDLETVLNGLAPKSRILDIGTGCGLALSEIREVYGFEVVGTGIMDIKPQCLFMGAVASALPFTKNSFELIMSVHGISWEPDQKKAIEEVIRVLKPGGIALLSLITFSNSIFLWYGEEFWDEIGVEVSEYKRYEFSYEDFATRAGIEIRVIDRAEELPEEYRNSYYLAIQKQ